MNTEQLRAEFEAWMRKRKPDISLKRYAGGLYMVTAMNYAWEGYQAGRAALQSQDREDAERYRWLLSKLQQSYDGEDFEAYSISIYSRMASQFKGERTVQVDIKWRDKTDEPIGLSEAIDHARRVEGGGG